ncbi:MAG: glycosyltransferase family 4 protein, partial [Desulfobacteraceae bacterium]|nr:glycosyltransferase family 4 protein [Desulfobacteraceae bacterium]
VGGIILQMYLWASTFSKKGWDVYSFSENKSQRLEFINFLRYPTKRYIGILIELFYSLVLVLRYRPKIIIIRGATRTLAYLSLYAKLTNSRIVFFAASDSDLQISEELIAADHDKKLFRYGLKRVDSIILQNNLQQDLLLKNYNKSGLVIPNIWDKDRWHHVKTDLGLDDYILWVSNFRYLKRPQWFIDIAKKMPHLNFVMVGGPVDKKLFEACESIVEEIPNLSFLGPQSLEYVNALFTKARVFVCTSTIEGFPNTFLQAWSQNVPVISTFDPSDIIKEYGVGISVKNIKELLTAVELLQNEQDYFAFKDRIGSYFKNKHDPDLCYEKLVGFLGKRYCS